MDVCNKRGNDEWSLRVSSRLHCCVDLVAEEARYHKMCHDRFHLGKLSSGTADESGPSICRPAHRPKDSKKEASFLTLCEQLECHTDRYLYSITELRDQLLKSGFPEADIYSVKSLKMKLHEHYGEHVVFVEHAGRHDVVCLTRMASFVLREQWEKEIAEPDDQTESQRIVKTAAKLVRAQLREMQYTRDIYPSETEISDADAALHFIPSLLHVFMQELIQNQLKEIAISNSIIQAARPRSVISPILFGLGVQTDHAYGSKWLLDELARLRFSISSAEVHRFKQSVMLSEENKSSVCESMTNHFTQWVGDNVDHNVASIDGRGSFHGMGLIAVTSLTGTNKMALRQAAIKRLSRVSAKASVRSLGLPIQEYTKPGKSSLSLVVIKELRQLKSPVNFSLASKLDLIWMSRSLHFSRHSWSALMQHVSTGEHNGKSNVMFLPIVDLNPSDGNCIYSTLCFIVSQAKLLNVHTPCITFD